MQHISSDVGIFFFICFTKKVAFFRYIYDSYGRNSCFCVCKLCCFWQFLAKILAFFDTKQSQSLCVSLLYEVYVGRQKNAGKILLLVKTEIERQTDRLNTALIE